MISQSDTVDPDSLLHEDVLDHHAAGQKTIFVSHLHIVSMVTEFNQSKTNELTEVEIVHPLSACILVALHDENKPQQMIPLLCG